MRFQRGFQRHAPRRLALLMTLLAISLVTLADLAIAIDTDKSPVQMALVPHLPRGRNGVMIPVDAGLSSSLAQIVTGRLELILYGDNAALPLLRMSVPEIAVAPGEQILSLSLPPMPTVFGGQITVEARLVTPRQTYDLGQHLLSTPGYNQRGFAIGICESWTGSQRRLGDLLATLPLERFDPSKRTSSDEFRDPLASTMPVTIMPDRLPTTPLGYTPFDIVVLGDEGFSAASPRALEALGQWVRAGGSVLILPTTRVQDHHLSLLNMLAKQSPAPPAFTSDAGGRLVIGQIPPPPPPVTTLVRLHCGLGRAVIATAAFDPQRDQTSDAWREAVLFLWKVRQSQWAPMLAGAWAGQSATRETDLIDGKPITKLEQPVSLAESENILLFQLRQMLAPSRLRLVPLPLIALLLGGYILLIGPADYLLLGRLRRRSWTWLALPLVTIAATFAIMRFSQFYMGSSSVTRSLHVIDVDAENQAIRQTQVTMHFSATDQLQQAEQHQALIASPRSAQGGWQEQQSSQHPLHVIGRPPQQYVVEQRLGQWTSSLQRITQLQPAPLRHALDFSVLRGVNLDDEAARNEAMERLRATIAAPASARVLTAALDPGADSPLPAAMLHEATPANLFSIVSQIAPTGGPSLEDLAIFDRTDPDQWLVVVEVHDGSDLYHYRHLVRRAR